MSVSRIAKWVLLAAIAAAAVAFVYVFIQSAYWNSTLLKCASPDPSISEPALQRIAAHPTPGVIRRLVRFFRQSEKDTPLRRGAEAALVRIGRPAVKTLVAKADHAWTGGHSLGKSAVCESEVRPLVGRMGGEAVEPLAEVLYLPPEDDEVFTSNHRVLAANILGDIGGSGAVDVLLRQVGNPDHNVRLACIDALGQIGDPRAYEPLALAARDKDTKVSSSASFAMVHLKGPRGIEAAVPLLDSSDSDVKMAAMETLASAGDRRGVSETIAMLEELVAATPTKQGGGHDDHDCDALSRADRLVTALGLLGDTRAVDALVRIESTDAPGFTKHGVRRDAGRALGMLGDPRALDALSLAAKSDDREVRHTAYLAIARISGDWRIADADPDADGKALAALVQAIMNDALRGDEASLYLALALERYGDLHMAEKLYRMDNAEIRLYVTDWARRHGVLDKLEAPKGLPPQRPADGPRPSLAR